MTIQWDRLLLVALCACSESSSTARDAAPDGAAREVELCDGSEDIRLAMRVLVEAGQLEFGQQVMYDNGAWFLFVDGTCNAHVKRTELWAPTIHAPLEDPASLARELQVAAWPDWAGIYEGTAIDGSTVVFEDGEVLIACTGGCADVVHRIDALPDVGLEWIEELAAAGEPLMGPVRLTVVRYEKGLDVEALEWPLSVDIETVTMDEVDTPLEFGVGTLIEGHDAEILRTIRHDYPPGQDGRFGGFIPFRGPGDPDARYRAYFRDALPFEGPDGLVPWFHER